MKTPPDAVVLGGGLNGLVASAVLARAGQRVVLLERRAILGGTAAVEEVFDGLRAPLGLHRFAGFCPALAEALELPPQHASAAFGIPDVAVVSEPGRPRVLSSDPDRMARALAETSERDAARYPEFAALAEELAQVFRALLLASPPPLSLPRGRDGFDLLRLGLEARRLKGSRRYDFARWLALCVQDLLDEWFESDWLKVALAAPTTFFARHGPRAAGTGMRLLHRLASEPGRLLGERSSYAVPQDEAVARLVARVESLGVEVRREAPASRIVVRDGAAVGVDLEAGPHLPARRVLSCLDPRRTFQQLVGTEHLQPDLADELRHLADRGMASRILLRMNRRPALFGDPPTAYALVARQLDDLERASDATKYGEWSQRPILELAAPGIPAAGGGSGDQLISVLVHFTPYGCGPTGAEGQSEVARRALAVLEEVEPGFAAGIEEQKVLLPEDLETHFGVTAGNLQHLDLTLDQFLFLRPSPLMAHYRTPFAGLFLGGSGCHPGGGPHGIAGWNAARAMLRTKS